jgi:hypothetical protein
MKLSLLIAIVLRLFSIYWAVACIVGALTSIGMVGMMSTSGMSSVLQGAIQFAVPVVYGIMALLAWIYARSISLRVVAEHDTHLSFCEVTAENFYTLGVLGFGLYYSIGNIAATINWIHYLIVNRAGQALVNQAAGLSLYDVTSVAIPCIAGAAIAILSPKIGKRLAMVGHRSTTEEDAEQAGSSNGG